MPALMKKEPLSCLFSSKRGNSSLTKATCQKSKGDYPVYTATIGEATSFVNFYEYENDALTYTTDGVNAGTVEVLTGKYCIGGHRAQLVPLKQGLVLRYFRHVLEPKLKAMLKNGSVPSVTWARIKNLEIAYPVTASGDPDELMQEELAGRLESLDDKRNNLLDTSEQIRKTYVAFDQSNAFTFTKIDFLDCFNRQRGRSCTKAYCNKHKGKYPVWSADDNKPIGSIDSYDYDGRYLTLSRNGIGGKTKILEGRFSINEDRFILFPIRDDISIDYARHILEPELRIRSKGRCGFNGEDEFTKISFRILDSIKLPVPIAEDGLPSLAKQSDLSNLYSEADRIKMLALNAIESVTEQSFVPFT